MELERTQFDLLSNVNDTVKTLAHRAHVKQLEINAAMGPDIPALVVGDPTRLRQVLVNLIGNSTKFTERGEIVARVEKASQNAEGVTLHFSVADTGIGIPLKKQAQIFEAFSQADTSTTRRFGGTGLGLAISSQLVEMMGGRIWVESAPGKDGRF